MLPEEFDAEHDFSALDAETRSRDAKAKATRILAAGVGALLLGSGVGVAAFGLSYLVAPRIAWCGSGDQICIGDSIGPHLTGARGAAGEKGADGKDGKDGRDGAAGKNGVDGKDALSTPPPVVGQKMSERQMEQRPDYQAADVRGHIRTIKDGVMSFTDSEQRFTWRFPNGVVYSWNSSRYDGAVGFCRPTGERNSVLGDRQFQCFASIGGRVVQINALDEPRRPAAPPEAPDGQRAIEELFRPT